MRIINNIKPEYFNKYILKGCMRSIFYSPSDTDSLCRLINKILEIFDTKKMSPANISILDLGCGSCIPTILLSETLSEKSIKSNIKAIDIDEEAINVGKRNIKKMGLENVNLEKKDIISLLNEEINENIFLIVSNPPYLPIPEKFKTKNLICVDGGEFGTKYTTTILRYPKVRFLGIQTSSLSDPNKTLDEIFLNGFIIEHLNIIETKFGLYTTKPFIRKHIKKLKEGKKCYFHDDRYLILGFILEKTNKNVRTAEIKQEFLEFLDSYSKSGLKNAYEPKVTFKIDYMRYKHIL
ncbi:MAG: methyltransferase domain-containing protein [Candidatus Aenigmarchaeota archaeon]|nr:methyltransferase domain-containing protein [Candidatus Aenigmarchaeota archaeon]